MPAGDRAVIALRAYEVFTSRTPLVGQYSASTAVAGRVVYSPGPLLYWLLAIPARFGSPSSLSVLVGIVNMVAIFITVALARRRGGLPLMLGCALALVLLSRSWTPETLHDIWNPSAALMPFTLLLFLCWSLACGEYKLLPLTVLAASFTVQSELTFLVPTLAVTAIGVGGLLLGRAGAPAKQAEGLTPGAAAVPREVSRADRVWPWALSSFLVLVVCWLAPAVDEFERSPGNLTAIARAAEAKEPKQGLAVGWHAVVRAVGIPPWWLRAPAGPFTRFREVRSSPNSVAAITALAFLSMLCAILLAGLAFGRTDLVSGAAIGLALALALGAVAYQTPAGSDVSHSLGYTMWWGSQTGMWVWLMVAYGCAGLLQQGTGARTLSGALATEARERTGPRSARVDPRLPRAATLTGLIALFATGTAVAAAQYPDQDQPKYHPIAAINAHLIAALDPSIRTVLVMGSHDNASFDVRLAIDFALRRRVLHVLDPAAAVRLNPSYTHDPTGYQAIVCVSDAGGHPAGRVVGRFTPPQKPTIIVSLSTPGGHAGNPPTRYADACRR